MDSVILDSIPLHINTEELLQELCVSQGSRHVDEVKRLADDAQAIGRPKALYKVAPIESRGEDCVVIEDTVFTSRVLRINLEQAHRVFAFVATCGTELDDWVDSTTDMLHGFWAAQIKEKALRTASTYLRGHIEERYQPGQMSVMNPGSLADWPMREQRAVFRVLGDPEDAIGVRLTNSLLMIPTKSVSGILFPTEVSFASCQLCPMERCPSRRTPYEVGLYDRKYRP